MHGLTVERVFVERGVLGSKPLATAPSGGALLAILKLGDVVICTATPRGTERLGKYRGVETIRDTEWGSIRDTERDQEDASRYGAGRQEGCCLAACGPSDQGTLRCMQPNLRPPVQRPAR